MKEKIKKCFGVLLILTAVACALLAYRQWKLYQDGEDEYETLAEEFTITPDRDEETKEGQDDSDKDTPKNSGESEEAEDLSIDWTSLFAQNSDLVGWIQMEPTVNYPIVQGPNNSYYLHKGFNGTYNINGSIFMNAQNSKDWTDKNTVVYGHNMNSGVMFGNNDYYKDKSYAISHPYFYIYTPDWKYTYKIFDVMTTYDASLPYEVIFPAENSFADYLSQMNQAKSFGLDTKVTTQDRIVTLSTCTSHGQKRFLIQGVLYSITDKDKNVYTAEELRKRDMQAESELAADATPEPDALLGE